MVWVCHGAINGCLNLNCFVVCLHDLAWMTLALILFYIFSSGFKNDRVLMNVMLVNEQELASMTCCITCTRSQHKFFRPISHGYLEADELRDQTGAEHSIPHG